MKVKAAAVLFLLLVVSSVYGQQEKGVDTQTKTIRDTGTNRTPAVNGTKQDTGKGSGIDFGKGRTPATPVIPNPYHMNARRDRILKAIVEVMRDRKLIVDDEVSRPSEGVIVSQPYTFIKGAVVTQPELNRFARLESAETRGWTRARYTIIVEVQAIDGNNSNISVNAKVEGRTAGPTGPEWVTLPSTGTAEQEFLSALIENVTGTPPTPGRP